MTKITPILAAGAAAIASLALTTPAQATSYDGQYVYSTRTNLRGTLPPIAKQQLREDMRQLNCRIDRAAANNRITWREARNLNRSLERTRATFRQYARGGFSYREKMIIEHQLDNLKAELRSAKLTRRGYERRGYGRDGYQQRGNERDGYGYKNGYYRR